MKFKELKNQIKNEQKELALKIRRGKFLRKPSNRLNLTDYDKRNFFSGGIFYDYYINTYSSRYRMTHIAYCMFFYKTPYEKIESSTKENNNPNKTLISKYIKEWESQIDEIVCDHS